MIRLNWSNYERPQVDTMDLEQVGWFRPQYGHWFNGYHIGFHGGIKHGDVEYCELPLHHEYRTAVFPEHPMLAVTEGMLDHPVAAQYTYQRYDLARYARGGTPVYYLPLLMDDEVVWEEWVNPNYQEQWRYIHRE